MNSTFLYDTARKLVSPGKGILAADESMDTANKRLAAIQVEGSEENRRLYRDLFLNTDGIEQFLSGVILVDETIRQKASNDGSFSELLQKKGVIPGIKVDKGAKDLSLFPGEKITEGLDSLCERLKEYFGMGARFAKWRAVITIDDSKKLPTDACIFANSHAMARYAALCQESDIVPIVEPEVLLDGNHTIERCEEVATKVLTETFAQLKFFRVDLRGVILKASMVLSGKNSTKQAGVSEIAAATLRCLKKSVPSEVPGIVFLSGGQTAPQATENLNAIVKLAREKSAPWQLSFSYARALQGPSLEVWLGKYENAGKARGVFLKRLKLTSAAREGNYSPAMEVDSSPAIPQ